MGHGPHAHGVGPVAEFAVPHDDAEAAQGAVGEPSGEGLDDVGFGSSAGLADGLVGAGKPRQAVVEGVDEAPVGGGELAAGHGRADGVAGAAAVGQIEAEVDVEFL